MLAVALADPAYAAALAKVGDKGFTANDTVTYSGRVYGHNEIAAMCDESYQRHRGEFTTIENGKWIAGVVTGGQRRLDRRNTRRFERRYKSDVYSSFGISWWTIITAGLMFWLAGPMGLVIAIVAAIFEYYLIRDISGDKSMLAAMGAA